MKTRKIKIILDGSILFGPAFPECSTIFEIPDTPDSYAAICKNKYIKSWEFLVPNKYSPMREILEVTTKILGEAGTDFMDVTTIMCLTQIVCDIIKEDKDCEELSRRLLKNQNSGVIPDVPMIKSIMGKMVTSKRDMRKVWIDGIIRCIEENTEPILAMYIKNIYK